ncbi:MAG: hypothetical protein M1819_006591 [Sarea resinae]|nr:MAG: hypothetical protein M1819_006591 [Sarea resinae]
MPTGPQAMPWSALIAKSGTQGNITGAELMKNEHDNFYRSAFLGQGQGQGKINPRLRGGATSDHMSPQFESDTGLERVSTLSGQNNTISFATPTGMSWAEEIEFEEEQRSTQGQVHSLPQNLAAEAKLPWKPAGISWADDVEEEEIQLSNHATEPIISKFLTTENPVEPRQRTSWADEVDMDEMITCEQSQGSTSKTRRIQEGNSAMSPSSWADVVKLDYAEQSFEKQSLAPSSQVTPDKPADKKWITTWADKVEKEHATGPIRFQEEKAVIHRSAVEAHSGVPTNMRALPWSFKPRLDGKKSRSSWRVTDQSSPNTDISRSGRVYRPGKERIYIPPKEDLAIALRSSLHKSKKPWRGPGAVSRATDHQPAKGVRNLETPTEGKSKVSPQESIDKFKVFDGFHVFDNVSRNLLKDPQNESILGRKVSFGDIRTDEASVCYSASQGLSRTASPRELPSQDNTARIKDLIAALFPQPHRVRSESTPIPTRPEDDLMSRPRASSLILSKILPAINRRTLSDQTVALDSYEHVEKELWTLGDAIELRGNISVAEGRQIHSKIKNTHFAREDVPIADKRDFERSRSDEGQVHSVATSNLSSENSYVSENTEVLGRLVPLARTKNQTIEDKSLQTRSPFSHSPVLQVTRVSEGESAGHSPSDASVQHGRMPSSLFTDPAIEDNLDQSTGSSTEQKKPPLLSLNLNPDAPLSSPLKLPQASPTVHLADGWKEPSRQRRKTRKTGAQWKKKQPLLNLGHTDTEKHLSSDGFDDIRGGEIQRGATTDIWKIRHSSDDHGDSWHKVEARGRHAPNADGPPKEQKQKESKRGRGRGGLGRKSTKPNARGTKSHQFGIVPAALPTSEPSSRTSSDTQALRGIQGSLLIKGLSYAAIADPHSPQSNHSSILSSDGIFVSAPQSPIKSPTKPRLVRVKHDKATQTPQTPHFDDAPLSEEDYFSASEVPATKGKAAIDVRPRTVSKSSTRVASAKTSFVQLQEQDLQRRLESDAIDKTTRPEALDDKSERQVVHKSLGPQAKPAIIYDSKNGLDPTTPPFVRRRPPTSFSMMRGTFSYAPSLAIEPWYMTDIDRASPTFNASFHAPDIPEPSAYCQPPVAPPHSLNPVPVTESPQTEPRTGPQNSRAEQIRWLFQEKERRPGMKFVRVLLPDFESKIRRIRPCGVFHIEKATEVLNQWCPDCVSKYGLDFHSNYL